MLVHELLERAARHTPDKLAIVELDGSATYGELESISNRFAHVCRERGVQPRDRVVLAASNSIGFIAAYIGVMKAGAAAVPLPPGPRNNQLAAAMSSCRPALAIVDQATAQAIERLPELADVPRFVLPAKRDVMAAGVFDDPPTPPPIIDIDDGWLAAIVYTSGSTGTPRGVMLTHRNVIVNTQSIISCLGLTAADRVMCVLPFHYVYGLSLLHTHLMVGGSIVIDNRFAFPNVVLRAMREHRVTGFAGVPSTFTMLLHNSQLTAMEFPDLRYVTQAGSAMPASHIQEWLALGPPVPFYVMYGATEATARLTCLPPHDLRRKLGSVGVPVPGVYIEIVTDDGRTAKPHEVGELLARGDNISPGYWEEPAATGARFEPRGYRTGDLGYIDDEGYVFLVGRRHDMLKVGGRRVAAREIEDAIHQHPAVREAVVVGAPHEMLGEVPVAFVTLREGLQIDERAICAHCLERLSTYKMPKIVLLNELPMRPGGKIDTVALRERARVI